MYCQIDFLYLLSVYDRFLNFKYSVLNITKYIRLL